MDGTLKVLDPFIVTLSSPRRRLRFFTARNNRVIYNLFELCQNPYQLYQSLLLYVIIVIFVWSWCFFWRTLCWKMLKYFEDSYKTCMLIWVWHHGGVILDRGAKSSSCPFARPVSVGRHTSVSSIQLGMGMGSIHHRVIDTFFQVILEKTFLLNYFDRKNHSGSNVIFQNRDDWVMIQCWGWGLERDVWRLEGLESYEARE